MKIMSAEKSPATPAIAGLFSTNNHCIIPEGIGYHEAEFWWYTLHFSKSTGSLGLNFCPLSCRKRRRWSLRVIIIDNVLTMI